MESSVSWGAVAPPYWSAGVGEIIRKHGGKSKEIIRATIIVKSKHCRGRKV
ncbi:Serine/threonine-protein kinase BCK1/SLK1/SSP31 [Sesbania bispinosa]|nr:Serine/threonine-protein kinase BCK1/SLK1/SSP31 [Sesbania bispinosa]